MFCSLDVKNLKVVIEDTIDDNANLQDIADDLPESVPRYIILSYKWKKDDGRLTYPLIFLYYIPPQIKPALAMLYSSTKHELGVKINVNKTGIFFFEEKNSFFLIFFDYSSIYLAFFFWYLVEIQNSDLLTDEWILESKFWFWWFEIANCVCFDLIFRKSNKNITFISFLCINFFF